MMIMSFLWPKQPTNQIEMIISIRNNKILANNIVVYAPLSGIWRVTVHWQLCHFASITHKQFNQLFRKHKWNVQICHFERSLGNNYCLNGLQKSLVTKEPTQDFFLLCFGLFSWMPKVCIAVHVNRCQFFCPMHSDVLNCFSLHMHTHAAKCKKKDCDRIPCAYACERGEKRTQIIIRHK